MRTQQVIVVTGCIASGKSTVARLLAREARRSGVRAAVVDLDLVYEMLADDPKSSIDVWRSARQTSGDLAASLLARAVELVIVDGEYWSKDERADLSDPLLPVEPSFVTLSASFEEALNRAQGDPSRGASKDPVFLRGHMAEFSDFLSSAPSSDILIDTEPLSAVEIARTLAKLLLDRPDS